MLFGFLFLIKRETMSFTNNLVFLLILIFFVLFYTVFNEKLFSFNIKYPRAKDYFIALYSALFYALWYPPAIALLIYYAVISAFAKMLCGDKKSKVKLWIFILLSLTPLLFFKYFDYFLGVFGLDDYILGLVLPLGLSFYAFSVIGYFVDLYQDRTKPFENFLECLLFVAFWPHLASGPILRAKQIFANILEPQKLTLHYFTLAMILISSGLVKKLLIADNIGAYVNWNIDFGIGNMSTLEAWATILGFSAQIYADFSGYSDMAIGFALLMGFRLKANFNYPYLACSLTEFWHRWHISLSTWFRDYLYIPLGGSRVGKSKSCFNLFIVFVLSGVWHGAGLGFAVWGALHGIVIIFEKLFFKSYMRIPRIFRWLITMIVVAVAWAFFRLDFSLACELVAKMFGFLSKDFNALSPYYVFVIFALLGFVVLDHIFRFYKVDDEGNVVINKSFASVFVLAVLLYFALNFSGSPLPFIYFDF